MNASDWKGCGRRRNIVGCVCWSGTSTLGPREDIVDDENGLLKFVAEEEWEGRLARERRKDCWKTRFMALLGMPSSIHAGKEDIVSFVYFWLH